MSFELSNEQERARKAVLSWYSAKNKPYFFLNGSAGVGKSSCVVATVESIKGKILYAAPTAKAALVMQRKGCVGAQTIHSLIYRPGGMSGDKAKIEAMQAELRKLDPNTDKARLLSKEITKLLTGVKPQFSLNLDSALREASLLVVDEISMVQDYVTTDLLSFGVPILVQGDLWQLPPVGAKNFFKDIPPDFTLQEVHRQAKDSPVIYLATLARDRKELPYGRHGDSLVTNRKEDVDALNHDQIIVGKHVTRHATNVKVRGLRGFTGEFPNVGEKVMCKNNDKKLGLINGDDFIVDSFEQISKSMGIIGMSNSDLSVRGSCHLEYFHGTEPSKWDKNKAICADFSYARTAHSCQGSEFDSTFIKDESRCFNEPYKWKYTALSRSAIRTTILT